jgi:hypothetical protein
VFSALESRDLGYALAALVLDAAELADRAPRGAGPRIREAVGRAADEEGRAALAAEVERRRRGSGAFEGIDASWLAESLIEEPPEVAAAVLHCLGERQARELTAALERFGRRLERRPGPPVGLLAELEPVLVERFRARVFPDLPGGIESDRPAARWLFAAACSGTGAEEIEAVAREVGLKVVVRAFSRISREDLAKLCAGLASNDSVRLVSGVVELNRTLDPDALRETQRVHLKILKAAGISREMFHDAGLAFLGAGLLAQESERTRLAVAYRLPEPLGRRLLDLSAPGAVPDAETCAKYAEELPGWLGEIAASGVARSWAAATGGGTNQGEEAGS